VSAFYLNNKNEMVQMNPQLHKNYQPKYGH